MKLKMLFGALSFCLMATFVPGASAADQWAQYSTTDDEVLGEQRGGFLVADGIEFDFSASLETFIDGQSVMSTLMTWTPAGQKIEQTGLADGQTVQGVDIQVLLAQSNLQMVNPASGTYVAGGKALAIQQIGANGIQNVLLNTADGLNIRQDLSVTLTLPNADQFQSQMMRDLIGARISRDATVAAVWGR